MASVASRFKPTEPIPIASVVRQSAPDYQYWRSLQFPVTVQEYGSVTHIAFQPTKPNYFAVSASRRVELYNPDTNELVKTFSRFHDVAYGASFRSDGKLLVAGNEDTHVRLFDVVGRVPLRIFKGHKRPVHVTKFHNIRQMFSAADDNTVRVWDIATEETVNSYSDHEDYIRCGCSASNAENILFTGSYDHTIRMFDTRTNQNSMTVNHGCPVESILVFPSGSLLLSAGGNSIKVWDILQGGKQLATLTHHHKTITCMCFNHDCTRLLSGGLDRHVKIYDVATYDVVHNIDYPASILSMDISHDDKTLVVGMTDKMLSIRHRKEASVQSEKDNDKMSRRQRRKHRSLFMGGQTFVPNEGDLIIGHKHKEHLEKYDVYFKKFEHTKALDEALNVRVSSRAPEITVAVMQELIRRDTIKAAVTGRSDQKLALLLKFIIRNITNISYAHILLDVAELITDIYAQTTEELSGEIRHLFQRLRNVIRLESQLQTDMYKLIGCMDILVNSNAQTLHSSSQKEISQFNMLTAD